MSIRDAQPYDIYVDANGKLWRCIGTCSEPTVIMEEIEADINVARARKTGGVSGRMWKGWERIFRKEAHPFKDYVTLQELQASLPPVPDGLLMLKR